MGGGGERGEPHSMSEGKRRSLPTFALTFYTIRMIDRQSFLFQKTVTLLFIYIHSTQSLTTQNHLLYTFHTASVLTSLQCFAAWLKATNGGPRPCSTRNGWRGTCCRTDRMGRTALHSHARCSGSNVGRMTRLWGNRYNDAWEVFLNSIPCAFMHILYGVTQTIA